MTPLQNLNKEQKMLWEASEKMRRYKKYCRDKRYLTEGEFPPLARTCADLKMSKTTVLKIQSFLKNKKVHREADRIRNKIKNLEDQHFSDVVQKTTELYNPKVRGSYSRMTSMIDTATNIFSAYVSTLLEDSLNHSLRCPLDPSPDDVASILFGRKITNLNAQDIKQEVKYWEMRFSKKASGRFNTIIAMSKKNTKTFKGKERKIEDHI